MSIESISDVEFGVDLPAFKPDTRLSSASTFAKLVGWNAPRFNDHEAAKKEGLPGAMIPGILSQGYLVAMIHNWAPVANVKSIDTVFRAPVIADDDHTIIGVVTDINEDDKLVEIDLTVKNSKGETRVFGTAMIEIP
ncbi:MAG: hypothetical protein KUG75_12930 [Pseudomonadales bacterium]|nr:hypothetical protein [Pseudomonadales bacterium]